MQNTQNLFNQWDFSPQILSGGIFKRYRGRTGKKRQFRPGPFRFYSLFAIRSGNARIRLNGESYRWEAPVAMLFQPGQAYELEIPRISECSWLDFGVLRRETQRDEGRQIYKVLQEQPRAAEAFGREIPLRVPDELFQETLRTCQLASGEFWMKSLGGYRAHVQLSAWLLLYLETLEMQEPQQESSIDERLNWILGIAARHFPQGITASSWAERAGISKRRLDELCVAHMGLSAKQHLDQLRFTHAQHLIRKGSHSIRFISHDCGYASPASFSRWFKGLSGMTPSEWKQKHL